MRKGAKPSKSSKAARNNNKEKVYVVDTNVIIHDPNILKKLKGRVFVPSTVLSELDKHKGGHSEKARNIREFARYIEKNPKKIWLHNSSEYPGTCDEQIITSAIKMGETFDVTLVTNDILMGIIARAFGVTIERHELIESSIDMPYKGVISGQDAENDKTKLRKDKELNKYLALHDGIYRHTNDGLKKLPKDFQVWGISHKNLEQRCALDALLNNDIKLVTLTGRAGTGKTLMAILGGLHSVLDAQTHKRLLVARPAIAMGQELGYLPGSMEEKLAPWMQPIIDNIEFVFDQGTEGRRGKNAWQDMLGNDILKMESLGHIRGRSIPNEFMIIDEAQNLTRHEIKTIISRAGENTKIILTGDLQQIDNPKVDSISNGLAYVIDKFKDQDIAAHIHFSKCERSKLAELASELL